MFGMFKHLFKERPYVYLGAPRGRFERTQQDNILRGRRLQGIRMTWPAHLNCWRQIYVSIDSRDSFSRRSDVRWRSSRVTRQMLLTHRWSIRQNNWILDKNYTSKPLFRAFLSGWSGVMIKLANFSRKLLGE